jgi:Tol biopolymer transport system component
VLASAAGGARVHRIAPGTPTFALPIRSMSMEHPAISPDGRRLVFTSLGSDEDIAVSRADGTEPRLGTSDPYRDRAPRWSPDGSRIAFLSDRSGTLEIWSMRPDGSDLVQLTHDGAAGVPVWSPDGTRVAHAGQHRGATVVTLDGGAIEALPALDGPAPFVPWSWSDDGQWIAGSADGIVLYSVQSGDYTQLTATGDRPVWQRDGSTIVYVDGRDLRVVDTRNGESRLLFSAAPSAISSSVSASRTDDSVYASLSGSPDELWLVELRD